MIKLTEPLSIIINNLCNMTCSHCSGLFNYDFTGVFDWQTHSKKYEKWAEYVTADEIIISGGEPYLNPYCLDWVKNVIRLWPTSYVELTTNGTQLLSKKDLTISVLKTGCVIRSSCHIENEWEKMQNDVEVLIRDFDNVTIEKEPFDPKTNQSYRYYSNGKLFFILSRVTKMYPTYYDRVEKGLLYFREGGERESSHNNCCWWDSFTLQHGLLYKCTLTTNYPEAKKQVKFPDRAIELLEQYNACDPDNGYDTVKEFIDNLPNSIPACELCAFNKVADRNLLSEVVTQDLNKKKQFRTIS